MYQRDVPVYAPQICPTELNNENTTYKRIGVQPAFQPDPLDTWVMDTMSRFGCLSKLLL